MRIDFSPPDIGEAEIAAVAEALRSGWITTGPRTKEFERRLAAWCSTPQAPVRVACFNSATAALESALRLLGIGPGDEVITTAYTYTATASVVCHVGATVVLIDTAPGSYEMNYEQLAEAVTTRTKAVIPVDVAGVMCDYERIFAVLEGVRERYSPRPNSLQAAFDRVVVLADGAHSFGATYKGAPSGSVADMTAFSFHAVKNLSTAEGGALAWRNRLGLDDEAVYKRLMLLSLHGQDKDALAKSQAGAWEYDIVAPLYKCNMTDIQAAIGLVQLERYPQLLAQRHQILARYGAGLADLDVELLEHYQAEAASGEDGAAANTAGLVATAAGGSTASESTAVSEPETASAAKDLASPHDLHKKDSRSSGHLCLVRLMGKSQAFRNLFIERMAALGVSCNVHYKPLPLLSAYKDLGFDIADFPQALAQFQNEVSLPLHTKLTDAQVDYVIGAFHEAYADCEAAGV